MISKYKPPGGSKTPIKCPTCQGTGRIPCHCKVLKTIVVLSHKGDNYTYTHWELASCPACNQAYEIADQSDSDTGHHTSVQLLTIEDLSSLLSRWRVQLVQDPGKGGP